MVLEVVGGEATDSLDRESGHLIGDAGECVAGIKAEVSLLLSGGGCVLQNFDVPMSAFDGAGEAGEGVEEGGEVRDLVCRGGSAKTEEDADVGDLAVP